MTLKRGNILQHMHGSKHNPNSPLKQTKKELKQLQKSIGEPYTEATKETLGRMSTGVSGSSTSQMAKSFTDWAEKSHAGSKMFIRTSEQIKRSKAKEKVEKTIKGGQGSKTFGL